MEKRDFLGLRVITFSMALFALISCSNDDGCTTQDFYLDKDKDGFGAGTPTKACTAPDTTVGQYVTKSGDTNDNDANINPDCELVFYLDSDNDGFGVGDPIFFCKNPDKDSYTDNDTAFDCDDSDPNLNPDVLITYYQDNDGDGFGDPNGQTNTLSICVPAPEGFVDNDDDCDDTNENANPDAGQITYYPDADNDGYGNSEGATVVQDSCDEPPADYSLITGDCNDNDPDINPDAEEDPNDGIDSNCDGEAETAIWTGPDFQFSKLDNVDWINDTQNHDQLTENIALTRSNNGYITNISWWVNEILQNPTENEDLPWEYYGRQAQADPVANVGSEVPNGGPQGIRWAILEQGGQTEAWDNFDLYGQLGEPTNFYSFNNIVTMCQLLNSGFNIVSINDDFGIDNTSEESSSDYASNFFQDLENIVLGVWLQEQNIYLTLTFSELGLNNGGSMTYTRSTPNN